MRATALTTTCCAVLALALPAAAAAQAPLQPQGTTTAQAGGSQYDTADPAATPTVPGPVAQIVDGVAYAPAAAPDAVKEVIWAGDQIVGMPYHYGGGHGSFADTGYDCSGTVSYALHGGALLAKPRDSSSFFRFGQAGAGAWVTIFTKSSHAYMTVAGIRLDTSAADDPGGASGPQWRPLRHSDAGYKVRHPAGL